MQQLLTKDTAQQQEGLAEYCRTGKLPSLKGITDGRLHHYRRLVYNVVDDTLSTAFPLMQNLLEEEEWDDMVHYFFSKHKCRSHKVWEMPLELYEFILEEDYPLKTKYPFFLELLWFEWLEVKVFMMEDITVNDTFSLDGDVINDRVVLNPEATIEHLHYPLHKKRAKEITKEDEGDYYVLLYRDAEGGVQFMDLSIFFAWMLEQIMSNDISVKDLLPTAEKSFGLPASDIEMHTKQFLQVLQQKKFLLGFKHG